jgi:hypothetical protein
LATKVKLAQLTICEINHLLTYRCESVIKAGRSVDAGYKFIAIAAKTNVPYGSSGSANSIPDRHVGTQCGRSLRSSGGHCEAGLAHVGSS